MMTRRDRRTVIVRRLSLSFLSCVASVWAGSLVVFGLLLLTQGGSDWFSTITGIRPTAWRSLGVVLVVGGEFIFMFMVADRMFPRAGRRLWVSAVEVTLVVVGLLACGVTIALAA